LDESNEKVVSIANNLRKTRLTKIIESKKAKKGKAEGEAQPTKPKVLPNNYKNT